MRGTLPIVAGSVLLIGFAASVDPAEATCTVGHMFTTYNDLGSSQIHTASSFLPAGWTISDRAYGCFWSFGADDPSTKGGDPDLGLGNDGGSRCGLAAGVASTWWIFDPNDPAYIGGNKSHWNTAGTDGCITRGGDDADATDPAQCMIVLLEDNPAGEAASYWALLTDEPDLNGNYELNSKVDTNMPIVLQPTPVPTLLDWARLTDTSTWIGLDVASSGVFPLPHDNCPPVDETLLVTGYRIYIRSRPAGDVVNPDRNREDGSWIRVTTISGEDPVPFDAPVEFTVTDCDTARDVYVCVALTFESGFESHYCSADALSPPGYPPIVQCGGPPVECTGSGDCDDGNECTADSCEPGSRLCSYTPVPDLTSCDGGAGICCGGNCTTPTCSGDGECDDINVCTTDACTNPGTCASACDNVALPDESACPGHPGICCGGLCGIPVCGVTADCDDNGTCAGVTCSNGGTCSAVCDYPACANGDGCCGPDCTTGNDDDCVPAGAAPDGGAVPGTMLTVAKPGNCSTTTTTRCVLDSDCPATETCVKTPPDIILNWGVSCAAADIAFEIYDGAMGHFTSHVPRLCSTGATSATFDPGADDLYYLIVPRSSNREGSYGTDSSGTLRPQAVSACRVQELDACATP